MSASSSPSRSSPARQYYLITNVASQHSPSTKEVDLHAESWKLPYSIDDADLTFDGKPLNMLYEENRSHAEHHVSKPRDIYSSLKMPPKPTRGRSKSKSKKRGVAS